jgi:hypothetical protein
MIDDLEALEDYDFLCPPMSDEEIEYNRLHPCNKSTKVWRIPLKNNDYDKSSYYGHTVHDMAIEMKEYLEELGFESHGMLYITWKRDINQQL